MYTSGVFFQAFSGIGTEKWFRESYSLREGGNISDNGAWREGGQMCK